METEDEYDIVIGPLIDWPVPGRPNCIELEDDSAIRNDAGNYRPIADADSVAVCLPVGGPETSSAGGAPEEAGMASDRSNKRQKCDNSSSNSCAGSSGDMRCNDNIIASSDSSTSATTYCGTGNEQVAEAVHVRRKHTDEKPYPCPVVGCGYAATQAGNLKSHVRTRHRGEKPFRCSAHGCDYAAAQLRLLKNHVGSKHDGEKLCRCTVKKCTYTAFQSSHIKEHVRTEHPPVVDDNLNRYTVEGCDSTSPQAGGLTRRVRNKLVTMEEKLYRCAVEGCSFTTPHSSHVKFHNMSNHTGEKPYCCTVEGCDYAVVTPAQLKRHSLTHKGEKPYIGGGWRKASSRADGGGDGSSAEEEGSVEWDDEQVTEETDAEAGTDNNGTLVESQHAVHHRWVPYRKSIYKVWRGKRNTICETCRATRSGLSRSHLRSPYGVACFRCNRVFCWKCVSEPKRQVDYLVCGKECLGQAHDQLKRWKGRGGKK